MTDVGSLARYEPFLITRIEHPEKNQTWTLKNQQPRLVDIEMLASRRYNLGFALIAITQSLLLPENEQSLLGWRVLQWAGIGRLIVMRCNHFFQLLAMCGLSLLYLEQTPSPTR